MKARGLTPISKERLAPEISLRMNIYILRTALGTPEIIKRTGLDRSYIGKPLSRTVVFVYTASCAMILECLSISKCITSVISDSDLTRNLNSNIET